MEERKTVPVPIPVLPHANPVLVGSSIDRRTEPLSDGGALENLRKSIKFQLKIFGSHVTYEISFLVNQSAHFFSPIPLAVSSIQLPPFLPCLWTTVPPQDPADVIECKYPGLPSSPCKSGFRRLRKSRRRVTPCWIIVRGGIYLTRLQDSVLLRLVSDGAQVPGEALEEAPPAMLLYNQLSVAGKVWTL